MSFKNGDRVTGVPMNHMQRKQKPIVTGYYDRHEFEFGGKTFATEFIVCGDIAVDCSKIREANRREKDTVLK